MNQSSISSDPDGHWTIYYKKSFSEKFKHECKQLLKKNKQVTKNELIVFFRNNIPQVFNMKVFGSACMSMFSGIEANDIDLCTESKDEGLRFGEWMRARFGTAFSTLSKMNNESKYKTINQHILSIGQTTLKFDIVLKFNIVNFFPNDFIESRIMLGRKGRLELLPDPEIDYEKKSIPWLIDLIKTNLSKQTLTLSASYCVKGTSRLVHVNKFSILQRTHAKMITGYLIQGVSELSDWSGNELDAWYNNKVGDWCNCHSDSGHARRFGEVRPTYSESMTFSKEVSLPGLDCIVSISLSEMRQIIVQNLGLCEDIIMIIISHLQVYDPVSICNYCDKKLGIFNSYPHMLSMCFCESYSNPQSLENSDFNKSKDTVTVTNSEHDDLDNYDNLDNFDQENHTQGIKPRDPRKSSTVVCKRGCNGCQYRSRGRGGRGRWRSVDLGQRSANEGDRGYYYDRKKKNFGEGFNHYYKKNKNQVFHFECFKNISDSMNPRGYGSPCDNICNNCHGRFFE